MNKHVIFVAGVHGVGKTTFVKKLSSILKNAYYSSSDLIKRQNSTLDFPDKKVSDVDRNQDILLKAITNFVSEDSFILDGHFVLLDSQGNPIIIPEKTFVDLSPKLFILLSLDVNIIHERLELRGNIISQETLEQLQKREIEQAYFVSNLLNATIIHLRTEKEIEEYLSQLYMKRGLINE